MQRQKIRTNHSRGLINIGVGTVALAAASMFGSAAWAQETPSAEDALSTDIVVTANKREERLSRVGGAVVAVSGAKLEERSATSLQDYLALIPGISIQSQGAAGWGAVQIRGVSSQNVSPATAT